MSAYERLSAWLADVEEMPFGYRPGSITWRADLRELLHQHRMMAAALDQIVGDAADEARESSAS